MKRISNWPEALRGFVETKRHEPFVWGQNDCCLFASDCVLAITGDDPAAALDLRGTYDSALSANRLMESRGGIEAIVTVAADAHDWAEIAPAFAQRGDVVSFAMPSGFTLGICLGKQAVFAGADGIVFQDTLNCRRAWRI
jgi:hypothetical protein